jgi:hypothetical protein
MQQLAERELHYDGLHCTFAVEQRPSNVIVLRISGTDVGEFGGAPMEALDGWLSEMNYVDFFIDARDVRGASIAVSGDWAHWLSKNKLKLRTVTMLTGTRLIQITAEFVRRFADLEGIMRICTEPDVFEYTLNNPGQDR